MKFRLDVIETYEVDWFYFTKIVPMMETMRVIVAIRAPTTTTLTRAGEASKSKQSQAMCVPKQTTCSTENQIRRDEQH